MRVVALARVAAEAEGLRWRRFAKRQARRGAWGALAVVFLLLFLVMLHLVAYEFLWPAIGPRTAALVILGFDAVMALVFGLMTMHSTPGFEEREAEAISRTARRELAATARDAMVVAPLARAVGGKGIVGAALTALFTQFLRRKR